MLFCDITFSMSSEIFLFISSFFDTPDTAMTVSLSEMQAGIPAVCANASAYWLANSPSSPMGEYFLKITVRSAIKEFLCKEKGGKQLI